jgi:hypothetical protein
MMSVRIPTKAQKHGHAVSAYHDADPVMASLRIAAVIRGVEVGGAMPVAVYGERARIVLATLALSAGRPVATVAGSNVHHLVGLTGFEPASP